MKFDEVCVGIITKPVGVKGAIKIHPFTSSPSFFIEHCSFHLPSKENIVLYNQKIKNENEIVANINGFNSRNDVEPLRLKELFVLRNELPDLKLDEYYLCDLVNLKILNQNKKEIGKVLSAQDFGAGTFLEIKLFDKKGIATIPVNKTSILEINLNEKYIIIEEGKLII